MYNIQNLMTTCRFLVISLIDVKIQWNKLKQSLKLQEKAWKTWYNMTLSPFSLTIMQFLVLYNIFPCGYKSLYGQRARNTYVGRYFWNLYLISIAEMRNRKVSFNFIKLFSCINYLIYYIVSYHKADTVTLVYTNIYTYKCSNNNFEH